LSLTIPSVLSASERQLEALRPKCPREDITYMHLLHKLLIRVH